MVMAMNLALRKKISLLLFTTLCLTCVMDLFAQRSSLAEKVWSRVHLAPGPLRPIPENPVRYSSIIEIGGLPPQDSPDIQVTTATNVTQSENSVCVSPLNDQVVLNSNNSSNYPLTTIFGADAFVSTNGGLTWTGSAGGTGGTNKGDPSVRIGVSGRFYSNYITDPEGGQGCAYSTNNGSTWTPVVVSPVPGPGGLADKNHMCVDNNLGSFYVNNLYISWTDFEGPYNNQVVASRSTDAGLTWSARVSISSGVAAGNFNHGANVQTGPGGEVYATWVVYDAGVQEVNIGFTKSTNGGASWGTASRIGPTIKGIRSLGLLGGKDMRVNSFPSMAVNQQDGSIYIVWTNIGVPGTNTGTERDIYMIKSTNGGSTWGTAVRVNQDTFNNGKDQWFPWIACDPVTGKLVVIFYDSRDFTSNDQANTYVAYSSNGGSTWQDFRVSDASWSGDGSGSGFASNYAGDYISIAIRNNKVYPVWTDRRATGARLSTYISPFALANTITVVAPNGGESWVIGSSQTITWTSSGVSGNVKIDLSTDGGSTYPTTLFASTANDGTEPWTVAGPASTTARVRIATIADPSIRDSSNANFTIGQPSITVTAPNGGESWPVGSPQTITWSSAGVSGTVKFDLSTDGGSTFPTTLFAGTANDGTETWTVTGPASTTARVRIASVADPTIRDSSNANFTMVQPTVTVTSPNGGEVWALGSSQTLAWTSTNLTGNVKIDLSTDGGSTFPAVITASTANDGTEAWTVTGPVSSTARIRVSSIVVPGVADSSNGNFSMVQPVITVTSPNGGESWAVGSLQTLTWTSANLSGNVKIDLSTDGGSTFPITLFAATANDGTEPWTVAGPASTAARMRVSSLSITSVADTSNANFTLIQPAITVSVPNGGEAWLIGSSQTIQWASSNVSGNVKIDLSTDGGSTFPTVLFASTVNDGSESWTVAGPATAAARVRISSVTTPSVLDASNANFTISAPFITVTAPNGGEVWGVGTPHTIAWTSLGVSGQVMIELSRNGGSTYETLFPATANDGSEQWLASAPPASNALIRVSSPGLPGVVDVSDGQFTISATFAFLTRIVLRDHGGESDSLEFGTGAGATDGIDPLYGEYELPPLPPGGLDVRWHIPGTLGTKRDVRDTLGGTRLQITYTGAIQPGPAGYPLVLYWNHLALPGGSFTLRYQAGGTWFLANMKQQDSLTLSDETTQQFQIVYDLGYAVYISVPSGWSMLSLPVTVGDRRKTSLFPTAVSNAFAYGGTGYVSRDTLDYGVGYWLKFSAAQVLSFTGDERTLDTLAVVEKWNMIGSISIPVPVENIVQIPNGIVTSRYFAYTGVAYAPTTTISPLQAYWVKVTQNGQLILGAPIAGPHRK